ncbi:hypothetical protein TcasGA2_TC011370 [Tribolium castaneum]|uniref:Uncharacterized protein n=1 Tax=Tribolium castaneum TaxID=7070 RepID=D6X493_TRICA|nr:hypothetical protein TcasGA2_TC011370 [Tribolium castaneum]
MAATYTEHPSQINTLRMDPVADKQFHRGPYRITTMSVYDGAYSTIAIATDDVARGVSPMSEGSRIL